jgi:predicted transcriptional regulator
VESKHTSIGDTELDLLKVLWESGPGTVREINDRARRQGRRWAYTTVLTMLHRLQAKGFVQSDRDQVAHVFRAALNREDLLRQRLIHLADQLCEGTATPLVLALVEGQKFTPAEIDQFRQLLDRLEKEKGQGPK